MPTPDDALIRRKDEHDISRLDMGTRARPDVGAEQHSHTDTGETARRLVD